MPGPPIIPADVETISFVPWHDPVAAGCGYPVASGYVETFWLPILGPSTLLLARRLNVWRDGAVSIAHLAAVLGLGHAVDHGAHSPVRRTLDRLVRFDVARWDGTLHVRTHLPPLPRRMARRLPPPLAEQLDLEHHVSGGV